uniref:Secreted protein n=1 Tax=Steinernema glaseri TaxID=37863 RepID=A0A1I7Y1Z1_9BILA
MLLRWTLLVALAGLLHADRLVPEDLTRSMRGFADRLRSIYESNSRIEYVERFAVSQTLCRQLAMMLQWTLLVALAELLHADRLVPEGLTRSMRGFADRLRSSYESNSRIEYVERDVQKQLEGWIEVHSSDFYETTQEFQEKIQSFFDDRSKAIKKQLEGWIEVHSSDFYETTQDFQGKIQSFFDDRSKAIKNIVSTSESSTQSMLYSSHRLVDDAECDRFKEQISNEDLRWQPLRTRKKPLKSGVHVNVETFVCGRYTVVNGEEFCLFRKLRDTRLRMERESRDSEGVSGQPPVGKGEITAVYRNLQWAH